MNKVYSFYTLSSTEFPDEIRYVGVTSKTVQERFHHHKYTALHEDRRSTPVSKWIYSVYQKGYDIIVNKIAECAEEQWEATEIDLIAKYKSQYKLLNIQKGGIGVYTKEVRDISGIKRSADAHKKSIVLLNSDLTLYRIFDSVQETSIHLNVVESAIGNVLSGRNITCQGYYVLLYKEYLENKNNINYEYFLKRKNKYSNEIIYCFNLDGTLNTKYDSSNMYLCPSGLYTIKKYIISKKSLNNLYWSYNDKINIKDYISPYKYKLGDKYYISQREIADEYGLDHRRVSTIYTKHYLLDGNYIEKI